MENKKYSFIENIFSIKNIDTKKVITIFGIRIKFKCQRLIMKKQINDLQIALENANSNIEQLKNQEKQTKEKIDTLQKQTEEKIDTLQKQTEEKITSLQKETEEKLNSLTNATKEEIEALNSTIKEEINSLKSINKKDLNSLENVFNKVKTKLDETITENRKKAYRGITKLENNISSLISWQQNFWQDITKNFYAELTENEKEALNKYLSNTKNYLEFGAGGSTFYAIKNTQANVYSVESDENWLNYLRSYKMLRDAEMSGRLSFNSVYIGKTKEWGYPVDESEKENYPNYSMEIFSKIEKEKIDLVLVDGRFRVACTLATILNCQKDTIIILHDYVQRPEYHIIEEFLDKIELVDTLAIFKIKDYVDMNRVQYLYDEYKYTTK